MTNQQKRGAYPLTELQIEKLLLAAKDWKIKICIQLMARAGLRRAEVVDLNIQNIDFENNRLSVTGKAGKTRLVPINKNFTQELKFFCQGRQSGPLVHGRGQGDRVSKFTINKWIKYAGQEAGVKNPVPGSINLNPHALRHACARHLKNRGLSIEAIQNILGHSSYKTTMDTYGLMSIDDVQNEFNAKV